MNTISLLLACSYVVIR